MSAECNLKHQTSNVYNRAETENLKRTPFIESDNKINCLRYNLEHKVVFLEMTEEYASSLSLYINICSFGKSITIHRKCHSIVCSITKCTPFAEMVNVAFI